MCVNHVKIECSKLIGLYRASLGEVSAVGETAGDAILRLKEKVSPRGRPVGGEPRPILTVKRCAATSAT